MTAKARGSASSADRAPETPPGPPPQPLSTYRLQFHGSFGFQECRDLLPYLSSMGVSHVYASPLLAARPGSVHGYDIVDHGRLNPELGTPAEFETLVEALHREGMGLILDFVPNHMGIGVDNPWWAHLLEWGQSSPYAGFFDIDWDPPQTSLSGKVLLPVLGDHYGEVLERGELRLQVDRDRGVFFISHGDARFPVAPREYPALLRNAGALEPRAADALEPLARELEAAAGPTLRPREREARQARVEAAKARLARILSEGGAPAEAVTASVEAVAGREGDAGSFDALHDLLERQPYRLAFWKVAAHEINYRRFFDINDLAGLRMEDPELFRKSHRLIGRLMEERKIQGLRLDHVDGLRDPEEYLRQVKSMPNRPYVVVEKILAPHERLRTEWGVDGTTGYEFLALVNGLLVDSRGERGLTRSWHRFVGWSQRFEEVEETCKRRVMAHTLASELNLLAGAFHRLAKQSRRTRDYTLTGLRGALTDVVANFSMYRTYVTERGIDPADRREAERAVGRARRRTRQPDTSVYDFILSVLTLDLDQSEGSPYHRQDVMDAALRFQQYTGPVMAKAVEDTAFYQYLRLASLNEVGGHPGAFGTSPAEFHSANQRRLDDHPLSMVTTSTHDHKRGEDVRARLAVLSEVPRDWGRRVRRWRHLLRRLRSEVDGRDAPGPVMEYLFYQTLVGAWPTGMDWTDQEGLGPFRARLQRYLQKAAREADLRTNWVSPDDEYEEALAGFVRHALDPEKSASFLEDAVGFAATIAPTGAVNALTQVTLKLTVPGVPDIYQGTELWDLTLVDPDNRRAVDYAVRRRFLEGEVQGVDAWTSLLQKWSSGQVKHRLMDSLLRLRQAHPSLLLTGDYRPLRSSGPHARRVLAFARLRARSALVVVVPRLVYPLIPQDGPPLPRGWGSTTVGLPKSLAGRRIRNALTGEEWMAGEDGRLSVDDALARLPVAVLLVGDDSTPLGRGRTSPVKSPDPGS